MYLPQGQVRVLKVQFFWTPPVGHFLQDEFNHFCRGVPNDRDTRLVKNNVFVLYLDNGHSWFLAKDSQSSRF